MKGDDEKVVESLASGVIKMPLQNFDSQIDIKSTLIP